MDLDTMSQVLEKIEENIENGSMLNLFKIGVTLNVLENILWNIDTTLAQRCNDLQHKILNWRRIMKTGWDSKNTIIKY